MSQSVLCTFEAYIHEGCPPTTYYAYLVSAMDAVGKNPARFNFIRCNVDIVPGLRQQCDIMFCNHVEQSIVLRAPLSRHCRAGVPCTYTEDELLALVLSGRDIYEKMTPLACKPKRFELQTLVTPSPSGHPMEAKHNSQETQRVNAKFATFAHASTRLCDTTFLSLCFFSMHALVGMCVPATGHLTSTMLFESSESGSLAQRGLRCLALLTSPASTKSCRTLICQQTVPAESLRIEHGRFCIGRFSHYGQAPSPMLLVD